MRKKRVLFVEDDKIAAEAVKSFLGSRFAEVVLATTVDEAMLKVQEAKPDIIITDICLPDGTGFDVIKSVKEKYSDIFMVVISAHSSCENEAIAEELGVHGFLPKPLDLDLLESILKEFAKIAHKLVTKSSSNYRILSPETAKEVANLFEQKLDASFLKDVLERLNYPIVRVDLENRFLYLSKSYAEYFGLDAEKMIGKVFSPQIDPDDIPAFEETHRKIKEEKKPATIVQRELTKFGWVWFEWRITPILDKNGDVVEIQSVGQDISSLIATKDTLNLIFQALEQTSAAVCITDRAGIILYANKKFKSMYGYSDKEIMGKTPRILKSELTNPQLFDEMWRTITNGNPYNTEIINKTKTGELKWVLLSISPIKNDAGLVTHFVAVSEDISFQKELENELRKAKLELEEINQALEREVDARTRELRLSNMLLKAQMEELKKMEVEKEQKEKLLAQQSKLASLGEMINMIAHQWRQPLTAISTAIINIQTKKALGALTDENLESTLNDIMHQTQKMSSTINDFLNFFKPSREKEHFKISTVVDETLELIGAQLASRGISVELSGDCDVSLYGFKNELEQVLINILSNSRDAFETNKCEHSQILIGCFKEDEFAIIEITDNAGGVDEKILDRLFEPYFTTKAQGKGTGIGLYMSKMIIQKSFNGDIVIKNRYIDKKRVGLTCIIKIRV